MNGIGADFWEQDCFGYDHHGKIIDKLEDGSIEVKWDNGEITWVEAQDNE